MLKIIKRAEISKKYSIMVRLCAILLALITLGIFIAILGHNPLDVYFSMVEGSFGTSYRLKETIIKTIPLIITSLGISVAFKMKFWNIGGEGQICMGAFVSTYMALNFPTLPSPILLTLMVLGGIIGGGLWALIPAYFKATYGTNETLFTLMMNYIALKWITYLQYSLWKDPNALGFPKIPNFAPNATLPKLFGVHIGWVIAMLLIIIVYITMNHTKLGYEISVIGESESTAKYAGMNVKSIMMISLFISGAIAGITGMVQASGVNNTLSVELSGGLGYTAIIIAWLSNLSAPIILIVSFLFAILVQGAAFIQTAFQIPQSAADILQGMVLIFVLGSEFFIRYKLKLNYRKNFRRLEL